MAWAFQLPIGEGEILSAYLSRAAFAHGSTQGCFYGLHLGDPWFWTRDIDRGVAQRHHASLCVHAGISTSDLIEMTLRPWIAVLTPKHYASDRYPAVVPWINAVSIYQTRRRYHALQYCPECLHRDGIVKREWRLSFVTHCPTHKLPLFDACQNCGAPFVPHRSLGMIVRCCECHMPLYRVKQAKPAQIPQILAAELQPILFDTLKMAMRGSREAADDLHALRTIASLIQTIEQRRTPHLPFPPSRHTTEPLRMRLEFGRIDQRVRTMANLYAILENWPTFIKGIASKAHITQQTFARHHVQANWLVQEILNLPEGRIRIRRVSQSVLEQRIHQVEMTKPNNWRARRAAILMQAAHL